MMNIYDYAVLIIGIPLLIVLVIGAISSHNILPVFILFGLIVLVGILLWVYPIYCEASGCPGRMEKIKTRETTFESKLQYRCKICNNVYETIIFDWPLENRNAK